MMRHTKSKMLLSFIICYFCLKADSCLVSQSPSGGQSEDNNQVNLPVEEAAAQDKDASIVFPESQDEDEASEGSNKFYCYLCSITCHNQQVGGKNTQPREEQLCFCVSV